jgi:hypothetical protein
MVSWKDNTSDQDAFLSGGAFFGEMSQGKTVAESISSEQAAGFGKSTYNGKDTAMGYLGDGTITLQQAANPPAYTPTPLPTPTPSTPTAIPTPTATPTPVVQPAPPLAITLRHKVTPGQKQVIQITSSPNTIIHVRIVFPSGDVRIVTTATDAAGHARVAFPQHSNRVTYQHVFATVTVDASRAGTLVNTIQDQYRIGWAAIDVAVVPHQQAVGKRVVIWVHSSAHAELTVMLHFPAGSTLTLQDSTAKDGWAQLPYKIGRYLKKPSNHTVQVVVSTNLSSKTVVAKTTFTIT